MSAVNPITQPEDLAALNVPPSSLLVLYFHAPWAAPCAQMSAVLDALASTYPTSAPVVFAAANAEDLPDLAEDHDVTAVPFVVLKRGDAILESISGSDAAKVRAAVEKHAGGNGPAKGAALPPAQTVTRPKEQPAPADPRAGVNGSAAVPAASTNGATTQPSRDMSAYAPSTDAPAPADAPSEEELNKRLSELVKAAPVMLFMKGTPSAPQCGFSRQLVGILREQSVRYGFFNILADDDVRQGLKKFADWPTFPQLWLDGDLVGGLDIVREEIENDGAFFDSYKAGAAPQKAAA